MARKAPKPAAPKSTSKNPSLIGKAAPAAKKKRPVSLRAATRQINSGKKNAGGGGG